MSCALTNTLVLKIIQPYILLKVLSHVGHGISKCYIAGNSRKLKHVQLPMRQHLKIEPYS